MYHPVLGGELDRFPLRYVALSVHVTDSHVCFLPFRVVGSIKTRRTAERVLRSLDVDFARRMNLDVAAGNAHVRAPRREKNFLLGSRIDFLGRGEQLQRLLGGDFKVIALCLDFDFSFPREKLHTRVLYEQADLFGDAHEQRLPCRNVRALGAHQIDMLVRRPFFTWADLTVGSYLASVVGLGGLLTVVFTLLAAVCGTLMGNVYLAALVLTLLLCGGAAAQALCAQAGLWMGYALLTFQPVSIWLYVNGWFTELGLNAFVPWQETIGTGLGLTACGLGTALALRRFGRKDVMT